jgi:MFS family permease
MLLWAAQFITQTAQQAIWFGMIIVVEEISQSSLHLTAAMLSTIIPGVLLGLIAGVVVDRSNKKHVLMITNLLRAVVVLGYLFYSRSLYVVYAVNFLFVGISQFFGPAESSTIPALVPRDNLVTANSMFNLTFTISQLVGIVLLAPWVIKFFGAGTLFTVTAGIYLVAAILTSFLPPGVQPEHSLKTLRGNALWRTASAEIGEAWRFITADRRTWWAMIFVTLASTLTLILAMLVPQYVVVQVGIPPEDAVFLFAPAGLGILVMSLLMTRLANRYGEIPLAYAGTALVAVALTAIAALPLVQTQLHRLSGWAFGNSALLPGPQILVPPLLAVSAVFGVGLAMQNIPSQSVLMDRAPVQSRGRIFSVLLLMGNVAAIAPLAFLGALAQVIGVSTVLGVVGAATFGVLALALRDRAATLGQRSPVKAPTGPARRGVGHP